MIFMKKMHTYGSIVKLKNNSNKLMIVGLCVEVNNKIHDYCAIEIPKGFSNKSSIVVFNNDDIDTIICEGYIDDEIKEYLDDLEWLRSKDE